MMRACPLPCNSILKLSDASARVGPYTTRPSLACYPKLTLPYWTLRKNANDTYENEGAFCCCPSRKRHSLLVGVSPTEIFFLSYSSPKKFTVQRAFALGHCGPTFYTIFVAPSENLSHFFFHFFVLIQKVSPKNQDAAKACARHRAC